jgi:hypothetical protein
MKQFLQEARGYPTFAARRRELMTDALCGALCVAFGMTAREAVAGAMRCAPGGAVGGDPGSRAGDSVGRGALGPAASDAAPAHRAQVPPRERLLVKDVASLYRAVDRANERGGNVLVLLADGRYRLARTLELSAPGIALVGASGRREAVAIEGDAMREDARIGNLVRIAAPGARLEHLTLQTAGRHLVQVAGESQAHAPLLRDCVLRDAFEQLLKVSRDPARPAAFCDGGLVEGCLFEYSAGVAPQWYVGGIDAHGARRWVVRANVFRHVASPGGRIAQHAIHFWATSADVVVERNVIVDCDRGIGFGLGPGEHAARGGLVRNNVVHHRDTGHRFADAGIVIEGSPDVSVLHNTVLQAHRHRAAIEYRFPATRGGRIAGNLTNRPIVSRDGGDAEVVGNFTRAAPSMFRLCEPGDLRLAGPVPEVVDRGVWMPDVPDDIDGAARPAGAAPDLGAHEWQPAAAR